MKKYSIRYTETYQRWYDVDANNPEEAENKLIDAIATGEEKPPEECCDSGCKEIEEVVMKEEPITVYAVHSNDYSGESGINVFYDESEAYKFMILDMEQVIDNLKEQGYECDSAENDDSCEVWAADNNIYYQWEIYESQLK